MNQQAYSVKEARRALGGISQQKFYDLVNSGGLRTFKIGSRRMVTPEAINELIQRLEQEQAA